MRKTLPLILAATLLAATPALAARRHGPGKPTPARTAENCKPYEGDQLEACKVVGTYLDLWKQKKWPQLKKLIHPKTLESIAALKKRIGAERDAMAPWFWAKETYLLNDWKITSVKNATQGTVVINTEEKSYRIQEDGFSSGEKASYLAGRKNGKWYVVERRGGGGGFNDASIEIGMKGYFDPAPEGEAQPAAADEKPAQEEEKAWSPTFEEKKGLQATP